MAAGIQSSDDQILMSLPSGPSARRGWAGRRSGLGGAFNKYGGDGGGHGGDRSGYGDRGGYGGDRGGYGDREDTEIEVATATGEDMETGDTVTGGYGGEWGRIRWR